MTHRFTVSCEEWLRPVLCEAILNWLREQDLELAIIERGRSRPEAGALKRTPLRDGVYCVIETTSPLGPALRAMCRGAEWHGSRVSWFACPRELLAGIGADQQAGAEDLGRALENEALVGFGFLDGDLLCYGTSVIGGLSERLARFSDAFKLDAGG